MIASPARWTLVVVCLGLGWAVGLGARAQGSRSAEPQNRAGNPGQAQAEPTGDPSREDQAAACAIRTVTFLQADSQPPDDMRAFLARIDTLRRDQSWSALEEEVAAWIAGHPEQAHNQRLALARGLGGTPDPQAKRLAEKLLREVLAADPKSVRALNALAFLVGASGRVEEAIQLNRELLAVDPDNTRALNDLAWILSEEKGRFDEALALAAKARARGPNDPHILDTHGVVCLHLKRVQEAEKSLQEALRLMPPGSRGAVGTRYHLAEVYETMGRNAEAADLFQRSLNLHHKIGGLTSPQASHAKEFLGQHPGPVAAASEPSALDGPRPPDPPAVQEEADRAASDAGRSARDSHSVPVNDTKLYESFQAGLARLIEEGKDARIGVLLGQLQRRHSALGLPDLPARKMTLPELYQNCRNSVLVVGHLYHCSQCGRQHPNVAGGFALTAGGAIATNYHVVNRPDSLALGAMTADGRVYAVKEVLAADRESDVAILQLDGSGFTPLALCAEVFVGAPVAVIGHVGRNFYTLTSGIVSHHFILDRNGTEVVWIAATADIGAGSSGAPLLNESGAVIGMAALTQVIQDTRPENHQPSPQRAISLFVPAEAILHLLGPAGTGASGGPPDPAAEQESVSVAPSWKDPQLHL